MITKSTTTITDRKPTHRAFADWRTIPAARSGDSSNLRVAGGDVKRSPGAGSEGGRRAGSRFSGSRPVWSVMRSDAAGAGRRNDPRLADRDRQRAEGHLAGVDREDAVAAHADPEPVHAARR